MPFDVKQVETTCKENRRLIQRLEIQNLEKNFKLFGWNLKDKETNLLAQFSDFLTIVLKLRYFRLGKSKIYFT